MPVSPPPSGDESTSRTRHHRAQGRDRTQKAVVACDRCREKKIKCDGTTSCRSCVVIGVSCHYSRTVRRYRGASIAKTRNLQRRLGDAERLLQTAGLLEKLEATAPHVEHGGHENIQISQQTTVDINEITAETPCSAAFSHVNASTSNEYQLIDTSPTGLDLESTPAPQNAAILLDEDLHQHETSEPPSRDEVHGPNSFASICADPGVAWIASRTGASNYATCATSFMSTISWKLKLRKRLSKTRLPDPPADTAWIYTMAYFNESVEATYHTVDRSHFEMRLRKHYNDPLHDDDPGWYALRNVVFASGCRIATLKSCNWTEAQARAQGYFDNALSVEADLLHGTPGLIAIQALLIMALFAEGLGSAKLEYMLIGCAVRLAYARGLHVRPISASLSFEDSQRRSWIFWTIYCFEKHLTMRAGRPSGIDDDDISCDLPTWAPDASSDFVECFRKIVDQAMLSSAISKSFTTVKARQRPLVERAELVKNFNTNLEDWYSNLSTTFKVVFPLDTKGLPHGMRAEHLMYLHLSYHGNMAAIHSIFGHPWNLDNVPPFEKEHIVVERQIQASNNALADASRNIIIITRSLTVDAVAPVWLVFYYPLIGMINIFISILKSPANESTARNIGVIDMAAGYFAYLDYSTDAAFSFPLVQNLAQWARQSVAQANTQVSEVQSRVTAETDITMPTQDLGVDSIPDMGIDIDGMDLGDWPAFLPRLPQFTTWS